MTPTLQFSVEPERGKAAVPCISDRNAKMVVHRTFANAGIGVIVAERRKGAAATLYEIDFAPNVSLRSALGLRNTLAAALGVSHARIVFGLPSGRVGVQVPNQRAWA